MRGRLIAILLVLATLWCAIPASAQIVTMPDDKINVDSLRRAFADTHYYFGLYKDNYFIFGPLLAINLPKTTPTSSSRFP